MTKNTSRTDGRMDDEVRKLELISGYTQNAPGSVLVSTGDTRIICTATFEEEVPGFLKLPENGYKHGWVTAEYGMLPGSTGKRKRRERPQVDGRTQEIQRLIGRSLRSVVNLNALGERAGPRSRLFNIIKFIENVQKKCSRPRAMNAPKTI